MYHISYIVQSNVEEMKLIFMKAILVLIVTKCQVMFQFQCSQLELAAEWWEPEICWKLSEIYDRIETNKSNKQTNDK